VLIDIPKRLQGAVLRIRGDHPFFGTLALFAEFRVSDDVATAATNGKVLWFNPLFVEKQSTPQLCGLVVHELLHAALQHVPRRNERDGTLWNIAADIVVNGMIRSDTQYELPAGGVEDAKLAHLSVEEIYEQLNSGKLVLPEILLLDLLSIGISAEGEQGSLESAQSDEMQRHWRAAVQQAGAVARRMNKGFW
jgi:predicted metal-dependent peptidase